MILYDNHAKSYLEQFCKKAEAPNVFDLHYMYEQIFIFHRKDAEIIQLYSKIEDEKTLGAQLQKKLKELQVTMNAI